MVDVMSDHPSAPPTQTRKSHLPEFQAVWDGTKTFDYRRHGTGVQPGDWFTQEEYDPERDCYTGRAITHEVTYVLVGDRAKEFGLPLFAEVIGLGRVVKRVAPCRHVLVVPEYPHGLFQVEHHGCPSTVRIYRVGEPIRVRDYEGPIIESQEHLQEEFPYSTVTGMAVTEHHCRVTDYLYESGFEHLAHEGEKVGEFRESYVTRVSPGRHEIAYRERWWPPSGAPDDEGDYEDWLEVLD
jgi:hypothetical protein